MSKEPRAGVIGCPVAHSRSPLIHGSWLARLGIAGSYERFHVRPEQLVDRIATLRAEGMRGLNVTLPHKRAVMTVCDTLSRDAELTGAVNTLTFSGGTAAGQGGGVHGDNTDWSGFVAALKLRCGERWQPAGPCVVLGAGGAAAGVIHGLRRFGVGDIVVVNRTEWTAGELIRRFPGCRAAGWPELGRECRCCGLFVNTTSLGMAGGPQWPELTMDLPARAVVADIVTTPARTPLLSWARGREHTCIDGLDMLIFQAIPGFTRWFGQPPPRDGHEALRALLLSGENAG